MPTAPTDKDAFAVVNGAALMELEIPAKHPALAGHFPGQPVTPAAVTLALMQEQLAAWLGRPAWVTAAAAIKFHRPVPIGQSVTIGFRQRESMEAEFRISDAEGLLVDGRIAYAFGDAGR